MFSSFLFELARLFASLGTFKHAAAIAGLTILVKIALSPLALQRIRTQIRIASLKPELDRLQRRHSADPKRLMVERRDLMRREGLSAPKTLLPNLVQMPVMIGMYRAIRRFKQVGQLGAASFATPLGWALLAATAIAQAVAARQLYVFLAQPQPKLAALLPVLLTLLFAGLPAGLALYWATGAAVDLGLQTIVLHRMKRRLA
jgi:YidC/Oxa1 family membrane protein insertase